MKATFDIAVIGSGAAGIAAAVGAARAGCKTVLLDKNPAVGGTGGFSGLTTLCGLYDDDGNFLNEGFTREFAEALGGTGLRPVVSGVPPETIYGEKTSLVSARPAPINVTPETRRDAGFDRPEACATKIKMGRVWVLPYRPEKFRAIAEKFFSSFPNLQTCWNSPLEKVVVQNERIISLNDFAVGAVIDCSGTAEVAAQAGIECLATDETTQASAVIFSLHHVTCELRSAADAAQILLPLARAGFPPINFQSNLEPDSVTAKFTGSPEQVPSLIEFLRAHIRGFENCSTPAKEFSVTRRAGRMIPGEYILTGDDVLGARKFPDAVARCAWPVEQWSAAGIAKYRYLPAGEHYEIPARSLRSARIKNLFMAGKTISADADAIASARVMGCCLATGAAAAKLAAAIL